MIQTLLFWLFALLGIAGALGLIFNRNPIYAALSLILNFFSIAGLYLSLGAEFLAAIQILVYAGAIMVLFLFVIMLLNLQDEKGVLNFDARRGLAFLLGLAFVAEMIFVFQDFSTQVYALPSNCTEYIALDNHQYQCVDTDEIYTLLPEDFAFGKVEPIGNALMTEYLFPFEMISVILLVALVGAIVVARKHTYN
ncbi:MAG: NADH-quinone oxidoreductase subunit J [Bacteroidota bacterium]